MKGGGTTNKPLHKKDTSTKIKVSNDILNAKRREKRRAAVLLKKEKDAEETRRLGYNPVARAMHDALLKSIAERRHEKKLKQHQYAHQPHKHFRSFTIENAFDIDPSIIDPVKRIVNKLMLSPIQSDDGLIVTVDAKKGNEARANVEYPSAMVHYYGKDEVVNNNRKIIQIELHMQLDGEQVQRGYV